MSGVCNGIVKTMGDSRQMKTSTKALSNLAFKRLVFDLRDKGRGLHVRFRLLGEMWKPNFMRLIKITERGAIFADETTKDLVFVSDLDEVIQFELDGRFQEFQPHYHYSVLLE